MLPAAPPTDASGLRAWRHSGFLQILTTPEGAHLPASVRVDDFPLLVRLHRDFFDFSEAAARGEDIRFSDAGGAPLAHQIETWDPAAGEASVWVRVPEIRGNARQPIRLHWGNPGATDTSNGHAVFDASNGHVGVWHLAEPVVDDVGATVAANVGTSAIGGVVGAARHFAGGQGVFAGDDLTAYPAGGRAHSTEAWFRAEAPNATLVGWGNEQAQGKVVLQLRSPPHVRTDCYFSDGNVAGGSRLPLSEWTHVAYTYENGNARIYVNGRPDGSAHRQGTPLNLRSPARLWLGGWYDRYDFVGDLDEVRVSNVARSADWIRLGFENQKPLQTLVGWLPPEGDDFSVAPAQATIVEGTTAMFTARAGGALKVYWSLVRDQMERVLAVDRSTCTVEAGRVTGDQTAWLRFKAVFADGVRTRDIPLTIREALPEPAFTLVAPSEWDGRRAIELAPVVSNLAAMKAKGVDGLHYEWKVSGLAVIRAEEAGRLRLKRAQNSGELRVVLNLDNGGARTTRELAITVHEPASDPWVPSTPEPEERPVDNQFYARDDRNEGTLVWRGNAVEPADSVFLRLYADERLIQHQSQPSGPGGAYTFSATLAPGRIRYRVELGARRGNIERVWHTATNLVCGDAFLIQGQSNALATDTSESAPRIGSDWIRTFGSPSGDPERARTKRWGNAVWKDAEEQLQIGYWGMELARRLVERQQVPICLINGAVGGSRIDQHQRNPLDPEDVSTIYGRLLWRVRQARLAHGIRGLLWHQGENDQGADGPTGGYGWETYAQYFVELAGAWKEDYPNLRHYYVFQIWPQACAMGVDGSDNRLREVQRRLPSLFSNLSLMSTVGIKPPGGCHFPLAGWAGFARLIQPLLERDHYGASFTGSITPANLLRAAFTQASRDEIALEFDQPVIWNEALAGEFHLEGAAERVTAGAGTANALLLKLSGPTTASHITYLDSRSWSPDRVLYGANGIAALTFCGVPIEAP